MPARLPTIQVHCAYLTFYLSVLLFPFPTYFHPAFTLHSRLQSLPCHACPRSSCGKFHMYNISTTRQRRSSPYFIPILSLKAGREQGSLGAGMNKKRKRRRPYILLPISVSGGYCIYTRSHIILTNEYKRCSTAAHISYVSAEDGLPPVCKLMLSSFRGRQTHTVEMPPEFSTLA